MGSLPTGSDKLLRFNQEKLTSLLKAKIPIRI